MHASRSYPCVLPIYWCYTLQDNRIDCKSGTDVFEIKTEAYIVFIREQLIHKAVSYYYEQSSALYNRRENCRRKFGRDYYLSFVTMPARPSTRAWTSLNVVCCCSHSSDSLSVQFIFTTSSCTSFCAACSSSWSGCVGSVCFSNLWISNSYRGIFCTGLISNWSSPSLPLCSRSIV